MIKKVVFLILLMIFTLVSCSDNPMSFDAAEARMDSLLKRVTVFDSFTKTRVNIKNDGSSSIADALPGISSFDLPVNPMRRSNAVLVEIFASTEKSGSGKDGWINEVAEEFNRRNISTDSGKIAQVVIRKIASGTGHEFIKSGKYVPTAISPSNELWIKMIEANGVQVEEISPRLVGNVAGVVMKKDIYSAIQSEYGSVNVRNIIDSTVKGNLFMGYTNPFASSTGLNFLQNVLMNFAGGDDSLILEESVVSAFEAFQVSVPFVSMTTIQMRESVENDGSLDAFVMEYQSFFNMRSKNQYEFIPFGIRHDNGLYAVGDVTEDEKDALTLFAEFCNTSTNQNKATNYGFNKNLNYSYSFSTPSGEALTEAQKLWKEKKDSGRPIVAVFLNDVSGSMNGLRISRLREALLEGSKYISSENYIGLINFNSEVTRVLEIKQYDTIHQQRFASAVQSMEAGGGTSMYDGILVALDTLLEARENIPNAKMMLFVLTDGETTSGLSYSSVKRVIQGLGVPVYTIGYGESISKLREISNLNEAASLQAETDEISYQISALLNAGM
jgi:Ca-activated chloride channel family protein